VDDDPAYFREDPMFFLAHEVAHQWWGQAVGWRNYREQWLSEGFAQYFAALYVREARGERAFGRVLAWLHRWAQAGRGRGPISLGLRAGEVEEDGRRFTAIVYSRGAYVLHMLRALVGDASFQTLLRRYLAAWKFRRAGTDDLRAVAEAVSGLDLERFFEQWVRGDGEPDLRYRVLGPTRGKGAVRIVVEQVGEVFDVPVDVSVEYADGRRAVQLLRVSGPREEVELPLGGTVRAVRVNDALTALATVRRW